MRCDFVSALTRDDRRQCSACGHFVQAFFAECTKTVFRASKKSTVFFTRDVGRFGRPAEQPFGAKTAHCCRSRRFTRNG